jgi:hypothetical protein
MTDAEALTYAIDFLRAFQPVFWIPPNAPYPDPRQMWTEAMERLEALRKAAIDAPIPGVSG